LRFDLKKHTARALTISALTLSTYAGLGCSTTSGTKSDSAAAMPVQRTISEQEALADFDAAWTLVNETHFDPNFNGVDWDAVRDELRPVAAQAQSRTQLRAVMQDMLGRLGQSHFGIIPASAAEPEQMASSQNTDSDDDSYNEVDAVVPQNNGDGQGNGDTGIDLRIIDGRAVVSDVRKDSPAASAGVKTGWVLAAIRDLEVADVLDQLSQSFSAQEVGIHGVSILKGRLEGREGSDIDLTFLDGTDREVELSIARAPMPGEFVKFGNLPPMSTHLEWSRESFTNDSGEEVEVGIIKFNIWMIPIAPKFERAFYELRDCDGLIIDLRGNPGGVGALSSSIGRFLLNEKGSLGTMSMRGAELQFNVEPVIVTTWGERIDPFAGPIAILQDSGSASTSEVFAGGMQSLGLVEVFGTRSAGMALPANMDKLPSGDVLLHAIADFVTSTGARMEYGGVVPDVEVKLTREDLLKGIDSPKRAAKEWIAAASNAR
jgi:carboxyl-terminal processing protease